MSMRLIDSLATTPALAELFSDESVLRAMLDFESALARAEARTGVIPKERGGYYHCPGEAWQFRCCCSFHRRFSSGYACNPFGEGADGSSTKDQRGGGAIRPLGRDQPGCRR